MEAGRFLKELRRMCQNNPSCKDCPANDAKSNECGLDNIPEDYEALMVNEIVTFVEKWSAEHPERTIKDDLLKKYPATVLNEDGVPKFEPWHLGYCDPEDCRYCHNLYYLKGCWRKPMED